MKTDGATEGMAVATESSVRRSASRKRVAALAVVLLMVGSAFLVYGLPGASAAPATTTHSALSAASAAAKAASPTIASPNGGATTPLSFSPRPAGSPTSSGRGTFLDSRNLSQVPLSNLSCQHLYYTATPLCVNTTFDPSINITPSGEIAVVNTQFTNYTHCPGVFNISNNTTLDIGFQSSTNGGLSWSKLIYLGNENCSEAQNLSEAWEPSLTSLSNGTLVVTYIEFSERTCPYYYCTKANAPDIYPYNIAYDDLVVQESYNGGANWTAPQVLNSTYNPSAGNCAGNTWAAYRPWISAAGNSVYVVWENYTDYSVCDYSNPYSSGVHLIASTNGGTNWTNATVVNFPTIGAHGAPVCCNYQTNFSVNPTVLAEPNGEVYVAYATGLANDPNPCQPTGCLTYSLWSQDVVVANTTNVSGNWTVNIAAHNVPIDYTEGGSGNYYGPFTAISPRLAYDALNGQIFVAYESLAIGSFCESGPGYHYCYTNEYTSTAYVQNSSNGGKNWSAATQIGNAIDPYGGPWNSEYYPTIVVDSNGTLHATLTIYNETQCVTITYVFCGGYNELYLNSTNNGTSWNGPYLVSAYVVTGNNEDPYFGEYTTATIAPSGAVYFAWTNSQCTPISIGPYCFYLDYYYAEPNTSTVVSWLYQGTGLTVTFHETNLTALATWGASLMGNYRQGSAGTNLVVSGVPSAFPVLWSVPWVNISYGTAWEPVAAPTNPAPPTAFSTSPTLSFAFQELVQVIVSINPPIYSYYVTSGSNEATYSMTPLPTTVWQPVNSTMSFGVSPQAINCATSYCYYYNLTWVSWTGTGAGSVSTNLTSFTTTVGSTPVNETANFLFIGYCENYVYGLGTLTCYNAGDYPLTFHESGLPNGTSWGVTTVLNSSMNGTVTAQSSTAWLNVSGGQTAVQFTAWTIPSATAGQVWVPTTNPASPVKEPTQTLVNVSYSLATVSAQSFAANFTAMGLPNGTAWSAELGSASYSVTDGNLSVPVAGGVALNLSGAPVYTENGVGFYASSVSVYPYVMNESWSNATVLPESYTFNGSAHVFVQYAPMYWLTVSASAGGNVTPTSQWVPTGNAVGITATASTGYHFLDWASVGAGGSTVAEAHNASVTIHPTAPVSELATFRKDPALTWNVTVSASGLPTGTGFTFTLGNTTYSATGTTTVGELLNGSYAFATANSYSASDNGTRWVPTSWYSTFGTPVSGSLPIASNGMIVVNYTTQYVLSVTSTPNGVVTPGLGSTWTNAGTQVMLTATPSFHYKFVGWNGSGNGSTTSLTETNITVTLMGPIWEAAAFDYRVFPPPAVFELMVTETGLPTGTSWNVSAGTLNASAAGPEKALNLSGLNGTYTLTVPSVYLSPGVRYVAAATSVKVTANGSTSVTFTEQFALTIASSAGGSVGGAGTTWEASGNSTTLSATAATGYQFAGWVGSGTGSANPYTGSSATDTVTVSGPTNETATFTPIVPKVTTGSSTAGQVPALGLLGVLLVVGLVVGLIAGRRRSGGSGGASDPSADDGSSGGTEEAAPEETMYGSAPMEGAETAPPSPDYDESTP